MQERRWPNYRVVLGALLLLSVFLCELVLDVRHQSLSWDEGDHIYAGYMSLTRGEFAINPEHPPLVKELAAIPLALMHLPAPAFRAVGSFKNEAYFNGRDFIFGHGEAQANRIIFRARMAAASLSLLLAVLMFLATYEMFGSLAALFAMTLLVFEPNIIAHGAYVTTDMGVTCLMFASVYAFYRYAKAPSAGRLLVTGLVAGLALAAKHSAVLLLPMAVVLIAAEVFWPVNTSETRKARALRFCGAFAVIMLVAVAFLWCFYGFRYSARPGGLSPHPSLAEYASGLHGMEPRIYLAIGRLHLLPESYLYGLIDIRLVSNWFPSYIFGKVYAHGVPFYFPAAFVIKSTIGFMALCLLTLFAIASRRFRAHREIVFLAVPPLVYLLVAMATGLNIGARHILPMYPFLIALIGGAVAALAYKKKAWLYAACLLLAWHVISSLRVYPDYIAYSNEFWGGPADTYKYLTDSNTDWGQQLRSVKEYLDARGVKDCWFAYFVEPAIRFEDYGIPCKPLPTMDTQWFETQVDAPPTVHGTVLISAGTLTGYEMGSNILNPYRAFQSLRPTATIHHGVFVYDGTFDMHLASALGHATRARTLAAAKQLPEALAEAKTAVGLAPEQFQSQMAYGDVAAMMGEKGDARTAYEHALAIAGTMEPGASAENSAAVREKLKTLGG